jgi:hypothetical protein
MASILAAISELEPVLLLLIVFSEEGAGFETRPAPPCEVMGASRNV